MNDKQQKPNLYGDKPIPDDWKILIDKIERNIDDSNCYSSQYKPLLLNNNEKEDLSQLIEKGYYNIIENDIIQHAYYYYSYDFNDVNYLEEKIKIVTQEMERIQEIKEENSDENKFILNTLSGQITVLNKYHILREQLEWLRDRVEKIQTVLESENKEREKKNIEHEKELKKEIIAKYQAKSIPKEFNTYFEIVFRRLDYIDLQQLEALCLAKYKQMIFNINKEPLEFINYTYEKLENKTIGKTFNEFEQFIEELLSKSSRKIKLYEECKQIMEDEEWKRLKIELDKIPILDIENYVRKYFYDINKDKLGALLNFEEYIDATKDTPIREIKVQCDRLWRIHYIRQQEEPYEASVREEILQNVWEKDTETLNEKLKTLNDQVIDLKNENSNLNENIKIYEGIDEELKIANRRIKELEQDLKDKENEVKDLKFKQQYSRPSFSVEKEKTVLELPDKLKIFVLGDMTDDQNYENEIIGLYNRISNQNINRKSIEYIKSKKLKKGFPTLKSESVETLVIISNIPNHNIKGEVEFEKSIKYNKNITCIRNNEISTTLSLSKVKELIFDHITQKYTKPID